MSNRAVSWEAKTVASGVTDFEGAPPGTSTEEVRAARKARQEQAAADKLAEEAKAKALKASEVAHGNGNKKARLEDGSAEGSGSGGVDVGSGFINPANLTKPTENGSGNDSGINPSSTQLNVNNSQSNGNSGNEPEGSGTGESRKRKPSAQSDEIGSDLDDPSDEEAGNFDDLDDENLGLCLYEKVQRVKNKWKCVLRDGIASVDGRDYLFSKCNGLVLAL